MFQSIPIATQCFISYIAFHFSILSQADQDSLSVYVKEIAMMIVNARFVYFKACVRTFIRLYVSHLFFLSRVLSISPFSPLYVVLNEMVMTLFPGVREMEVKVVTTVPCVFPRTCYGIRVIIWVLDSMENARVIVTEVQIASVI